MAKETEPDGTCEQRDHAGIDDNPSPQFTVQFYADEQESNCQGQQYSSDEAKHPDRKK